MKLMLPAPRMVKKSLRPELANAWFPNHALLQGLFTGLDAQPEARRRFLANFNPSLGDGRLVYSYELSSCQVP